MLVYQKGDVKKVLTSFNTPRPKLYFKNFKGKYENKVPDYIGMNYLFNIIKRKYNPNSSTSKFITSHNIVNFDDIRIYDRDLCDITEASNSNIFYFRYSFLKISRFVSYRKMRINLLKMKRDYDGYLILCPVYDYERFSRNISINYGVFLSELDSKKVITSLGVRGIKSNFYMCNSHIKYAENLDAVSNFKLIWSYPIFEYYKISDLKELMGIK